MRVGGVRGSEWSVRRMALKYVSVAGGGDVGEDELGWGRSVY